MYKNTLFVDGDVPSELMGPSAVHRHTYDFYGTVVYPRIPSKTLILPKF